MNKIKQWLLAIWTFLKQTSAQFLRWLSNLFVILWSKIKLIPSFLNWPPRTIRDILKTLSFFLVVIYILLAVGFAVAIYQFRTDGRYSQAAALVFPLPAAIVGQDTIFVKDFFRQVQFLKNYSTRSGQTLPAKSDIYKQVLDHLVEDALVQRQAQKLGVKVTTEDLKAAWDKIYQEGGGKEEVEKVLTGLYGMTNADFEKLLRAQILKDKIRNEKLVKIHARHILLSDENRARELLDRVKKGEDFGNLAKEFSEDQNTKEIHGDLGWFEKGTLVLEFEKAVLALKPGEIAPDIVKTEFGFHIIKLEERKGTIEKSYPEWLDDVKKKTKIFRLVD